MRFKEIINLFKQGNVCVTGSRGTGKDVLMGNVINRRNFPYVSNLDYGEKLSKSRVRMVLELDKLDIKNKYSNFIEGNINKYVYPYPLGADIYLSDAGVYLPSQYNNLLNRDYEGICSFQALSRQIARCNFHVNVQNLNRAWDKVREQSEIYIRCNKCFLLFANKWVFQVVTIYDKYQSCLDRVNPCRVHMPLFASREEKRKVQMYLDDWYNKHGMVKRKLLIYKNKSKHNTLYFGDLLAKKI